MILVTGGCSQGKREFVRQYLGEQDADGFVWTEGEKGLLGGIYGRQVLP